MQRRTLEQLKEQYEIEKELARTLRTAPREERRNLYTTVYNELYRRVPHHPQLARKVDSEVRALHVDSQMLILKRFLSPNATFLEIGPGDCSLALAVAHIAKRVFAVDVSDEITVRHRLPENMEVIISDGCTIPVPAGSVDLAYSNQLIEHLHPDDATEQLYSVYHALANGGAYVSITPNRLNGPHDISKYFDDTPTGFHLHEYTITELARMFRNAGFKNLRKILSAKNFCFLMPILPFSFVERLLDALPFLINRKICRFPPLDLLLNVKLVATKIEHS